MESDSYKKDDLIVALGFTVSSEGISETHYTLARVIAVGKSDLFAIDESSSYSSLFRIPVSRCVRIETKTGQALEQPSPPAIGDLVMSVTERFGSLSSTTGVLMEIQDFPGKRKSAKVLEGDEFKMVPYESLIVLE